jgi:hypothetical protein
MSFAISVEKGNLHISETEYIAPATLHDEGKPASQIIHSNLKEIVDREDGSFERVWP